jgi:hypothetical protein
MMSSTMQPSDIAPNRQAAILLNLRHYHGQPCTLGHGTARTVSNNACIECNRLYGLAHKRANADRERARKAAYRKANPDVIKAQRMRRKARLEQGARALEKKATRHAASLAARQAEKEWKDELREALAAARKATRKAKARETALQREREKALAKELAAHQRITRELQAKLKAIRKANDLIL